MEKNVTVKWAGKMTFVGQGSKGDTLTMDAGSKGSLGLGHSPMDLLLLGAGGCASIDVVMILQKGRHNITDCVVDVGGDRAKDMPRLFTDIHMHFVVTGENLPDAAVARAVKLSMETYCSASATLAAAANLTYDYEVVEG